MQKISVFLLSLLLWASTVLAQATTFGPEFELYHPTMAKETDLTGYNPVFGQAKMMFVENLRQLCKTLGCEVIEVEGKWEYDLTAANGAHDYQVKMPDGWWIKVSHDPMCVEITAKPSTMDELLAHKEIMNKLVFNSGKALGFRVPPMGMAHFNIGILSAFKTSQDFLRFFVDYQNHPELAAGVLGHDFDNAPPLAVLGDDQRQTLNQIVKEVQAGRFSSVPVLADTIARRVYTRSYNAEWGAQPGGNEHYQAIGLKYVRPKDMRDGSDKPMELRSMWNQKDAEHFIKVAELVQARIDFLKKQNSEISYKGMTRVEFDSTEARTRFFFYLNEMGLSFARYKELLPYYIRTSDFDWVLDESAPLKKRLENMKRYADLKDVSPGFRAYALDLLNQAKAKGVSYDRNLLAEIKAAAMADVPRLSGGLRCQSVYIH